MARRVFSGSRGVKTLAAGLLLLVLFAWMGSGARGGDAEAPLAGPASGTTTESAASHVRDWDGFKSSGPELPVERLVVTMAILLGVAGIALWTYKRFGRRFGGRLGGAGRVPGRDTSMQLLGRLPLGGRRGLVLVRAAGRILVLGVSEAGVQKVMESEDLPGDDGDAFASALERAAGEESR